jgi:hypothetical protein
VTPLTPPDDTSDTPAVSPPAVTAPARAQRRRSGGKKPRLLRLTPKLRGQVLEMIGAGIPLKTAAVANGVPARTFFDWLAKGRAEDAAEPYASFAREVDEAMERWAARAVRRIDTHGEKDWRAEAWLLERKRPEEWADPNRAGVVTVNVGVLVESAEWRDLAERLLDRLAPFPEALAAVADLMGVGQVVDVEAVEVPAELEAGDVEA